MVEMLDAIEFFAYLIELYLCTNLGEYIKLNNLELEVYTLKIIFAQFSLKM